MQNFAQEALQNFQVKTFDSKVYVSWTLIAGYTCQGTNILRSTDSISFHEIGNIQGVCGSVVEPISYTFIDDNPAKNQKNYYQLELGENGPSPILSVEYIELGSDRLKTFPNPATTHFSLAIENAVDDEYLLEIFDSSGHLVESNKFRSNLSTIDLTGWKSGIFYIQLTNLETNDIRSQRVSVLSH